MTCGIYRIEIGKYFYIGSSKNVESRIKDHLKKLKNKKHTNSYMKNVYEKHSKDFSYFVLQACIESTLEEDEKFWVEMYYDLPWNMNLSKNYGWRNGSPMNGRFHTEETKQKLREANGVFEKKKSTKAQSEERFQKYLKFGSLRKDWWNASLDSYPEKSKFEGEPSPS